MQKMLHCPHHQHKSTRGCKGVKVQECTKDDANNVAHILSCDVVKIYHIRVSKVGSFLCHKRRKN